MRKDNYEIEKNIEKIKNGGSTGFLTQNVSKMVKARMKKGDYQELFPYPDAEKTILYSGNVPSIKLYRIDSYSELTHSSIMGSLFSLNITSEVFGDIVLYDGCFYVYLLDSISDLIEKEFVMVGHQSIHLVPIDLSFLSSFQREYEEREYVVSSLRIDTICSKIVCQNRGMIQSLVRDKQIFLNYEVVTKHELLLKEGDIFSIRGYGKYLFQEIIGKTKKENYIILLKKYI